MPLVIAGVCGTTACVMLTAVSSDTPMAWLLAGVRRLRRRRRVRQRAHHQHRRLRDASRPGRRGLRAATTARNVGQTLGVAGAGAVVASRLGPVGPGDVASATHSSWWLLAACGAVVLLLGAAATTRRAEASAHRVAAQLNPEALSA